MFFPLLFEFNTAHFVRSKSNAESTTISFYNYDYEFIDDFCTISHEWASTLSLIAVSLGVATSLFYLVVAIRHFNDLASKFLFLNNFLLASFINIISNGVFDVMTFRSFCWYGSRQLCKALPTILDTSENAMIFFIVTIILDQNHPYVHSFLSKNTKLRKRTIAITSWFLAGVFSIPEVYLWDLQTPFYSSKPVCAAGLLRKNHHHFRIFKAVLFEYFVPLLLLTATLTHAATVLSRRRNPPTTGDQGHEDYRNEKTEPQEETNSHCPPIRVTSVAIGVTLLVLKTPYYISLVLAAFYLPLNFLYIFSFVLYPIPSIVAPVLVLFFSRIHKKRLKETYQVIVSCVTGRDAKEEFLLSAEGEEKL